MHDLGLEEGRQRFQDQLRLAGVDTQRLGGGSRFGHFAGDLAVQAVEAL
jgi:hypothetical protein